MECSEYLSYWCTGVVDFGLDSPEVSRSRVSRGSSGVSASSGASGEMCQPKPATRACNSGRLRAEASGSFASVDHQPATV